ncbi:hypothetical protein CROQUDRAFT_674099 [Cronartium quercuum f. sp. fusiforme G11]|uniref:Potassium channel domain-containing protein n=1 Tax=Cronartium quercuum f. sp. fusiforme G11 TaxID=708437 RepID=A0A9P6T7G1_9BASI|nr:hypothetical protein CROQUDRAFT_674099 [Cronartium quercuum f. sp. fusiforme G11]
MGFLTAAGVANLIPSHITRRILRPLQKRIDCNKQKNPRDDRPHPSFRWAPLFAGICCPNSILLELPVLTEPWSKGIVDGSDNPQAMVHPPSLVAAVAFSLISGFIANLGLISRYFEYRPQISTLTAIGFLTIHDLINLTVLIVFPLGARASGHVDHYTQSFWMMVASSAISLLCNVGLITDYCLVDNFRAKGSGLTNKQRSLVITCMALLFYIGFGALIFVFITDEKLHFGDALYFCVCTVTTVGFGDITPTNPGSRAFVFFYAIFGIITLALTVNTARETIVEGFEALWKSRRKLIFERAREFRLARKAAKQRTTGVEAGLSTSIMVAASVPGSNSTALKPQNPKQPFFPTTLTFETDIRPSLPSTRRLDMERTFTTSTMDPSENYKSFTEKLLAEERKEYSTKLAVAVFLFLCFWLLGGVVCWTYGEALYFGYVAFLTLGYGDLTVKSPGGRAFFLAWSIMGIATMTLLLSVLAGGWENKYKSVINKKRKIKPKIFKMGGSDPFTPVELEKGIDSPTGNRLGLTSCVPNINNLNPEILPQRLTEAAREFSSHAKYWMEGKKGTPPDALTELMEQVQDLERIEDFKEKGGLAKRMMSEDRQKMLFLVSYARTFELLISTAEDTAEFMKMTLAEVEALRALNRNTNLSVDDYTQSSTFPGPSSGSSLIPYITTREIEDGSKFEGNLERPRRSSISNSPTRVHDDKQSTQQEFTVERDHEGICLTETEIEGYTLSCQPLENMAGTESFSEIVQNFCPTDFVKIERSIMESTTSDSILNQP